MITVVYCTREHNQKHIDHLKKMAGHPKVEIIEYINNGVSLTKAYNELIEKAKFDVVVFCHDDIEIKTKQFAKKLKKHYDKTQYAILGVAGTKVLPENGMWWSDPSKMYGRVWHTHEGKTFLSKYSEDLGTEIEETVIVDGVFFSVKKSRLKVNFDETVEGFHFYDVDFCFRNYLEGVKIGVHTNIVINHMSIGETNEKWEENRVLFSGKYKDDLPIKIDKTFTTHKMKVLIGCLNFQGLTGSEISTLETAKGLSKTCDVSVISGQVSKKFEIICRRHGIKTYTLKNPPGYRLGDGVWGVNTPEGFQLSKEGMLYKISASEFDIIHANHTPITERLLQLYPECKFINIVRSEVIDLENPIVDDKIKKYIAIRPSIKDYIVDNFGIDEGMVEVIYNPFDKGRFKNMTLPSGTDKPVTLFVGTMDYLRKAPIEDLIKRCDEDNKELWLVGKDTMGYANEFSLENDHVNYFPPTDNIEEFFYKCTETAGILLGRTTIEGFLCGKPAIIYTVDKSGNIKGDEFMEVPEDLSIFDYDTVIGQIKNTYIEAYNG